MLCHTSFKYAFVNKAKGTISLQLEKIKDSFCFTYWDNGAGLVQPENAEKKKGLGTTLIAGLCKQLYGEFEKINSDDGLKYVFQFKGLSMEMD